MIFGKKIETILCPQLSNVPRTPKKNSLMPFVIGAVHILIHFFFYKEILRSSRNKTVFMLPCKKRYCCHDYGSSRRTNETRKQRMRVMKIKNNNQKEIVKEFEGFVKVIKQKSQSVTLETANCPYSFQWKDIVKEYHNYLAVQCLGILHLR